MNIAKIVSSNSHIDYVARVIDGLDSETPPEPADYVFGQFVAIDLTDETAVGVIYDSRLVNPEYATFGPRLSPRPALGKFSPDFINEQGILIGILLLGTFDRDQRPLHGVPRRTIPPGSDVTKLDNDRIIHFHRLQRGEISLHYYPQVVAHAGSFAVPLLSSIINDLCRESSAIDRERLQVLQLALVWQDTMGGMTL